jgi:hypothetical protein
MDEIKSLENPKYHLDLLVYDGVADKKPVSPWGRHRSQFNPINLISIKFNSNFIAVAK